MIRFAVSLSSSPVAVALLLLSLAQPAAAAAPVPPAAGPSLVSFSAGALVVQPPAELDANWTAFWMFDERQDSGWATPEGVTTAQTMVVALPERTLLERLELDTGNTDGELRGAKDVRVEMSDTSATTGFQTIATLSIQDKVDRQSFPVAAKVPGRFLRITVLDNHGASDYIELMDFRGYGSQLTHTPFPDASGTYETDYGDFHLRQQGTSVSGCYEHNEGLLVGGIEGRVMKFNWRETASQGPAMMVFSPDGKQMLGLWWYDGDTGRGSTWNGTKKSATVGSCPHWSGDASTQLASDLEQLGRARIYGINFDSDAAVVREESKPTLDRIAALLEAKPAWKLTIEGHTDSTATPEHNQRLSQQRAEAVKAYLVAAGIDAARLTAVGFGATRPVAPNDTETGRAENRRVELTKG